MDETMTLAFAGCGSRGRTYAGIAAELGADRFGIVAVADPVESAREAVAAHGGEGVRHFPDAAALLAEPRLAETLVVAVQDPDHYEVAMAALDKGYHLLLEKPAATDAGGCTRIFEKARAVDRRVVLCFVLRYTPFYRAVRGVLDSGRLGRLISIEAFEGVDPFHQAHSYVRGHWARVEESSPMILAKCVHDADLLTWLAGSDCESVSSFGDLTWFRPENAPEGAPARCTDGCPHQGTCALDAHQYLGDKRRWLRMLRADWETMSDADVLEFLRTSHWGRCAWRCDNTAVDHQVLAMRFANGITATFTMTAFDRGRRIALFGTKGVLWGGPDWADEGKPVLWFRRHEDSHAEPVSQDEAASHGYAGHGGGDFGLMAELHRLIREPEERDQDGLAAHMLAFAAERSRMENGRALDPRRLEQF